MGSPTEREQRARCKEEIILRLIKGEPLKAVLADYPDMRLSPSTWSRLKRRYEREGFKALLDKRRGLPYKMRPEIRDFIIAAKDSDLGLSLRGLAERVKIKFGVNLSKSYINQILREAGISGPVGRRPKKVIIKEAKVAPMEIEVAREEKMAEAGLKEAKAVTEELKAVPEEAEVAHMEAEVAPEEVGVVPREVEVVPMEYAGCFFLKGADCDILGSHTITNVVERTKACKDLSGELITTEGALQAINELLLYLPLFGVKRPEDLNPSRQKDLSLLIGSDKIFNSKELDRYLILLEDLDISLLLADELSRCNLQALAIRVELEDKSSFYIDGHLKSLWPDGKIPEQFCVSLSKTKSYINRFFLNSSKGDPLILSICPGYIYPSTEFFNLMEGFEGLKAIKDISIVGPNGSQLEIIKGIRPTKRYFVAYLSPWQYRGLDNFRIKSDFIDWKTPQYPGKAKIADAEINLVDSQTGRELLVRAALIREEESLKAIITNLTAQDEPDIKKVASAYFRRWPNKRERTFYEVMQQGLKERGLSTEGLALSMAGLKQGDNTAGGTPTLMGLFSLLLDNLNRYVQNHYFPPKYSGLSIEEMVETFYKQKGYVRQEEDSITVTLDPYDDPKFQEAVEYACRRFNEGDVKLTNGQTLRIYLG